MRQLVGLAAGIAIVLTTIGSMSLAWGDDNEPLYTPDAHSSPPPAPHPRRRPQNAYGDDDSATVPSTYDDVVSTRRKTKDMFSFGLQAGLYYDAISQYDKMYTPNTTQGNFTDTTSTGFSGMQIMGVFVYHRWEFMTGIDYTFPIAAQGQQSQINSNFAVNSQTINVFGVKALQVGYRLDGGQFTVTPYGGVGFYYGRDVVNLTNYQTGSGTGVNDQITYSKLTANFIVGVRMDFNFTQDHSFTGGIALEGFMPTKLADSLAQSGTSGVNTFPNTSELPGYESNLQSTMDFMTNFGGRIVGNLGIYF